MSNDKPEEFDPSNPLQRLVKPPSKDLAFIDENDLDLVGCQKPSDFVKCLTVEMPDKSVWAVPVIEIALHRAKHCAEAFGGDVDRSMNEDTIPLFASTRAIRDWARQHMRWEDVKGVARQIKSSQQGGWEEGKMDIKTIVVMKAETA